MLERVAGSTARLAIHGVRAIQSNSTAALASARACKDFESADALCPGERVEVVFDAEHRRRVDRHAGEEVVEHAAIFGEAEQLRHRPARPMAREPLDGARRQYDHAVRRFAAENLLPGEGGDIDLRPVDRLREQRRGGIGEGEPAAVGSDPVAVRHAHARRRAVPGEDDVAVEIDRGQIRQPAVVGLEQRARPAASARRRCRRPSACRNPPRRARRRRARRACSTAPSRRRRCRSRARWRGDSRPAARAARASGRWRASAALRRRPNGASGQAAPSAAHRASSRGAWRTGRRRSSGFPGAAQVCRYGSCRRGLGAGGLDVNRARAKQRGGAGPPLSRSNSRQPSSRRTGSQRGSGAR